MAREGEGQVTREREIRRLKARNHRLRVENGQLQLKLAWIRQRRNQWIDLFMKELREGYFGR